MVTAIVIALMLSVICGSPEAQANFGPSNIFVGVTSPSGHEMNPSTIMLKVWVEVTFDPLTSAENRWIGYSLDGQDFISMTPIYRGVFTDNSFPTSNVTAEAQLTGLSNGYHAITVCAKYTYGSWTDSGTTSFHFNVGIPNGKDDPPRKPMHYTLPTVSLNTSGDPQTYQPGVPIPYTIKVGIPTSWFINGSHFQLVWGSGRLLQVG
jgi:hypothetical protein